MKTARWMMLGAMLGFVASSALGLHPELLAAIDKVADERGDTRRDVVHGIIRSAAEALPPVDEDARARKR